MISLGILAFVTLTVLVFLASQTRLYYAGRRQAERAEQLIPVDLDAFENLIDLDEEQFLKFNLSPPEFRQVQRSRLRAARVYVAALSGNAGILVGMGQSARLNPNPETAAAGAEIIQRALQLKVWCLLAMFRLSVALVFPTLFSPSTKIANQYLLVSYMVANLPRKVAA